MYSVHAAETHDTIHSESGMRYPINSSHAPGRARGRPAVRWVRCRRPSLGDLTRRPRPGRHDEWAVRQHGAAALAQRVLAFQLQGRDIGTRWSHATSERLPPGIERRVLQVGDELDVLISRRPAASNSSARCPSAAPARPAPALPCPGRERAEVELSRQAGNRSPGGRSRPGSRRRWWRSPRWPGYRRACRR